MTWLLFVLLSVVFFSITNLLQRALMKKQDSNPIVYATVFQIFCTIIVASIAFARGFTVPPITSLPLNFLLLAFFYAGMNFFLFKAYQTIQASTVTILMSSRALWTILVALLFLGETYNLTKTLGTVIILFAVFLVTSSTGLRPWLSKSLKKDVLQLQFIRELKLTAFLNLLVTKRPKHFHIHKGELYVLAAAFCLGVASANDAYILKTAEPFSFTVIAFLFPSLVLLASHPQTVFQAKQLLNRNVLWRIIILSLVFSTAVLGSSLAYAHGAPASQAGPITNSAVILTVVLAAIFLKEREDLVKKLFATMLVVIGIALLS